MRIPIPLAHESTLDNFVIDNVVVFFKNRSTGLPTFELCSTFASDRQIVAEPLELR